MIFGTSPKNGLILYIFTSVSETRLQIGFLNRRSDMNWKTFVGRKNYLSRNFLPNISVTLP